MNTAIAHTPSDMAARARFVPGYGTILQMSTQLIAEHVGGPGLVLVLGAGGGLELEAFAARMPGWTYLAVDPDRTMLEAARERARGCGAAERISWVEGRIFDAPPARCDAATCLLTLHFIVGEQAKLETLRALRARLRPGAPFVLVDLCMDRDAQDYGLQLDRYERFALDSGADPELAVSTRARVRDVIDTLPPLREQALLGEAGFGDIDLFYAGLSWRGWVAHA